MKVEFLSKFDKDLDGISQRTVLKEIEKTIINIEKSKSVQEISNLKKLKGYKNAYRIRMGDYRIGVFINQSTVEFARIAHRKNIYKLFP